MLLYTLISYYLAFAFVLVHFFVALSAIFDGKNMAGNGFILAGALVGFSYLLILFEWPLSVYLWLFGNSLICYGSVMNARNNKKFNKSHQQICFFIYFFITIFIFFGLSILY